MHKIYTTICCLCLLNFTATSQIPPGYYNEATGKTCAFLKTALYHIVSKSHHPVTDDSLFYQYRKTDIKPREKGSGSDSVIWDIYSDNPKGIDPYNFDPVGNKCGNYNSEGDCFNREHTVPSSWFNDETVPAGDYHHILPTDGYVNSKRSNYVYGEVSTPQYTSTNGGKLGPSAFAGVTGTVFEPLDSFKGDVARAFFYFITRYEDKIPGWSSNTDAFDNSTFPSVDIFYLQQMLSWNELDPVSQKEIDRNEGGYKYQKNRNPFIDHPEYVQQTWNGSCPGLGTLATAISFFSGRLMNNQVLLTWMGENGTGLDHFEVEKSYDGIYYSVRGIVTPNVYGQYNFSDDVKNDQGLHAYYRLKGVDADNSVSYSAVFSIEIPAFNNFTIYPNPAKNVITIRLDNTLTATARIECFDLSGKMVLAQRCSISGGVVSLPVTSLNNGVYYCRLWVNEHQYIQKVIIQK